jgi:hypothetical protein
MTKMAGSGSRIRIRIPDPNPNPDPDPLVRDMDPRIRIRIHPKMSWIRNLRMITVFINNDSVLCTGMSWLIFFVCILGGGPAAEAVHIQEQGGGGAQESAVALPPQAGLGRRTAGGVRRPA